MRQLWQAIEALHDVVYFTPAAGDRLRRSRVPRLVDGLLRVPGRRTRPGRPGRGRRAVLRLRARTWSSGRSRTPGAWRTGDEVLATRRRIAGDALREVLADADAPRTIEFRRPRST